MELIEIQNYNKGKAGSIKPFVKEVLENTKYAEVKTVFLSPLDEILKTEVYEKRWRMEFVGKFGEDLWMKADKDELIQTLGETKPVKDAKVVVDNFKVDANTKKGTEVVRIIQGERYPVIYSLNKLSTDKTKWSLKLFTKKFKRRKSV